MDEEEELDNTLIGREEEAPAINTEGALMGNIPRDNLVSFVNTSGQQSDVMTQLADTASSNIGVPMTGMRPIDPTTGQPLSQGVIDAASRAGLDLPQASVPLPQLSSAAPAFPAVSTNQPQAVVNIASPSVQAPATATQFMSPNPPVLPSETIGQVLPTNAFSLESAEQVNPMMRPLTQGQLNAIPAPLPEGVQKGSPQANFLNTLRESGNNLTEQQIAQFSQDAQDMGTTFDPVTGFNRDPFLSREASRTSTPMPGQTLSQFMRYEDAPEQRTEQFVDPQGRLRRRLTPQASALQELAPGVQPLAPEYAGFEQASIDLQNRLRDEQRQPGETQAQRDTRVAQSRTQSSRLGGGLSQADLRDLAEASATDANPGQVARGLGIQQREGLGEFKPDMTPLEVEAEKALIAKRKAETGESEAALADTDSFNTSISNFTSPQGVVDYNKALGEYVGKGGSNKGYLEFLRKGQELEQEARNAGRKPKIKVVRIGDFNVLTQDGKFMTATTIGGEEVSTSAIRTIEGKIQLIEDAEKDYFSGDPERIRRAERTITALDIKDNEFGGQSTAKDYFEPDAGPKAFNPNTLSAEDKQFYDRLIGNDKQAFEYTKQFPNSAQTQVILKYLEQTYPDVD